MHSTAISRLCMSVSVTVDAGESVALVGANGAGKTTFLKCVSGLIAHKRGSIAFDGREISATPAEADRPARNRSDAGRSNALSQPQRRGKLANGRTEPPSRTLGFGACLSAVSVARRAPAANAEYPVRRPTRPGRDREGANGQSTPAVVRRDLAWTGAGARSSSFTLRSPLFAPKVRRLCLSSRT